MCKKQGSSVDSDSKQAIPAVESIDPEIKNYGQRALVALARRNYMKAMKIVRKSISCHQDSPQLHNVEALIHLGLAKNVAKDSAEKLKHLKDAAHSAHLATALLPNSVSFSSTLVSVHFQLAIIGAEKWGKVIELCKRGLKLKIEDSTDPGIDQLLEQDQLKKSSKESRIKNEKEKIMNHLRVSGHQKNHIFSAKEIEVVDRKDHEKEENTVKENLKELEKRRKQIEAVIKSHNCVMNYKRDDENIEKIEKYTHFWKSTLNSGKKRDFCKVIIEELESHFKTLKYSLALKLLSEAIGYAKENETWRCWECCFCHQKFGDCYLYRTHMKKLHRLNHDELELQFTISSEWIEMIENWEWKPVDPDVATEIVKHMESEFHNTGNIVLDDQKWRFCDDSKRAKFLEKIREILHLLLKNKCLAPVHLIWAMLYTIDRLWIIIPASQFRHHGLENRNVICLLGAPELQELLKILKHLAKTCGLNKNPGIGSSMDSKFSHRQVCCIRERVVLSREFSCLLLDGRLSQGELNLTNHFNAVADICEDEVIPDSDDPLSWLYMGPRIGGELESWISLRDCQRGKAEEVFQIIVKEISHRGKMIDLTSEIWKKIEAVLALDSIYLEEIAKSEENPEHVAQPFANLLRKRQKELQGNDDTVSRTESDIISNVLDDKEAIEALLSLGSDQPESEQCGAELELGMMVDEKDFRIRLALQHRKIMLMKDIAFISALVLRSAGAIQQYEHILEKISVYDYRSVIVPLLKSFLQAHLEDLFERDAADNKSEAAREALLAQLALDAEKNVNEVCEHVRQKHDKKNKKKKNKNYRETNVHFQLHQNDAEQGDTQNSEVGLCENTEELKELNEIKERQVPEHLEYQKQMENETKKKFAIDAGKNLNKVCDHVRQKHDKKNGKKKKKKHFRKDRESKATDGRVHFQLHENEAEQVDNQNSEVGICESTEELKELNEIEERKLVAHLECQKQIENKAKQKCLAEKRLEADIEKAVYLSLDSFEKHYGPLTNDVKDGQTPRLDVLQYVIIQSQWRLRQLRDEFMSRSEIWHVHAGNPCFLCAYRDSFSAMRIASRDIPEEAFVPTSSRKLAVHHFLEERLNKEDLDDKDATEIDVSTNAYELKQMLVAEVRKIFEDLEREKQIKNEAKQKKKHSKQFNESHANRIQSEIDLVEPKRI